MFVVLIKKTPEKTVIVMSLVVLETECTENNIVKEIGVYNDVKTVGYFFFLQKNSNQHPNILGVRSIFKESVGEAVTKHKLNLKKCFKKISNIRNGIFCKNLSKN